VRIRPGALGRSLTDFFHSIRFRLTLWFVLILALVLAVFSVFIYFTQSRDLRIDAVSQMQGKFVRVQSFFQGDEWQLSDLSGPSPPGGGLPLQEGDLLLLVDPTGSILGHWGTSIANPQQTFQALVMGASQNPTASVYERTVPVVTQASQSANADYLFIISPLLQERRLIGFLVIGSPSQLFGQQRRLVVSLALGSAGMLLLAFLGGLWLADRAMRPVAAISRAARTISEGDLGRRLNLQGRNELTDLAQTFDAMIARLQAAFDRQRRFVADASHELRTPLTIINLEVGRALSGRRSAGDYQRALKVVDAESGRMTRLVNDLMSLARMDSGEAILRFGVVDLSDAALEAVERLTPLGERRNIGVEVGDLPELDVCGDRQYLVQMVSNLIENGIKYSRPGDSVRVDTLALNGDCILRVADTGPGIPSEHLPVLFDRFYRVDKARSASDAEGGSSGSGLGLSIVAWVVKAHHGKIRVESNVGQGTLFEVTLPRADSQPTNTIAAPLRDSSNS
jgi:two-component system OmpR family sensor kinase